MDKNLSILFVTSEVLPFVKVGGLADVSFSLPLALRDMGHDVRVMVPKYGSISERKNKIHEINRLRDIPIPISGKAALATVKSSSINNPRAKCQAYITTSDKYFNSKKGIYSDVKTGKQYADNDQRFAFFCRSVIETCLLLGWFPDVIHCNDWQAAIIPAYAKALFPSQFANTKFVFTIHNISSNGDLTDESFDMLGMPEDAKENFYHDGKVSYIKAGIHYADYVTTVSEQYAEQLLTDKKLTGGLNEVLIANKDKFKGILNGIDTWLWKPEKDQFLAKKYNKNFEDFKFFNKDRLFQEFELETEYEKPMLGIVTQLTEQKGAELLLESLPELLKEDITVVMLAEGNSEMKKKFRALAKKNSKNFSIQFGFSEEMAHLIEAGTDLFLIPSKVEPCGLNAYYSLAYGSIPIVSNVGGLPAIVKDIRTSKDGNGFLIEKHTKKSLLETVKTAIELFKDTEACEKLAKKNMAGDYSWSDTVGEYDEIYAKITK
jgi:starch synthase